MNSAQQQHATAASHGILSAVVVYEDLATRDRAAAICDDLVRQFWPDIRFQFDWWRVSFFEDDGFADLAVQSALVADIVIFCGTPDHELHPATKRWFEKWSRQRDGRDGALVDLTETSDTSNGGGELKKLYLRDVASRALMDYITKPPTATSLNLHRHHGILSARLPRPKHAAGGKSFQRQFRPPLVATKD
jgi:hypothetical protein